MFNILCTGNDVGGGDGGGDGGSCTVTTTGYVWDTNKILLCIIILYYSCFKPFSMVVFCHQNVRSTATATFSYCTSLRIAFFFFYGSGFSLSIWNLRFFK